MSKEEEVEHLIEAVRILLGAGVVMLAGVETKRLEVFLEALKEMWIVMEVNQISVYSWIERPCPMDVGSSTATRLSVDQKETGFGILSESSFIRKNIGFKQFWRANF